MKGEGGQKWAPINSQHMNFSVFSKCMADPRINTQAVTDSAVALPLQDTTPGMHLFKVVPALGLIAQNRILWNSCLWVLLILDK